VRRLIAVLLLVLAPVAARADEPDALAEARRATADGDLAAAIRAYDLYLAQHPDDLEVRLEAAKIHSWAGDYPAAIDAYRAHLATAPGDRRTRLELAKVLSWAGRYDESIPEFETLLAESPGDRDALLGLARVQSWAGRLPASIASYEKLIAADPADVEARVGLGRALSWSGNLQGADEQYDAALALSTENAPALLGKAQVAHWSGDEREAARFLERAEAAAPEDRDVAAFRAELERSARPVVEASFDRVQDTDGNDYKIFRASAAFHIAPGMTLAGVYSHAEAFLGRRQQNVCIALVDQEGNVATVQILGARLDAALGDGITLRGMLGAEFVDRSVGDSRTRIAGNVSGSGPIAGSWRWYAGIDHRTFDATRVIVDCDVVTTSLSASADGAIGSFRLGGGAGATDLSDGNLRLQVDAWALRPFPIAGQTLEVSYRFRWMRYDENPGTGYFAPQGFISNLLGVALRGKLGTPRVDYTLRVEGGLQSFHVDDNVVTVGGLPQTLTGFEQRHDTVFGWEARVGWQITAHARVEAYYGETDYAAQAATGFESAQAGLLFRYRF
jgi:tetratricopeptide (TPR) repeat protein